MGLIRFVTTAVVLTALAVTSVTNAASIQAPPVSAESLRFTQVLFAGVINKWISEGETKYRPDFLLQRIYFKTFLNEWNKALEQGQIQSSRQFFQIIQGRNTYLGRYFKIWKSIQLSSESDDSKILNLGYNRNLYLKIILDSEEKMSFEKRLPLAFESAMQYFSNNSDSDSELGIEIVTAFLNHSDPAIRAEAEQALKAYQNHPNLYAHLVMARNAILTLGIAAPEALVGAVASLAKVGGVIAPQISKLKFFWPKEILAKIPSIGWAGALSAGVHGGVMVMPTEKPRSSQESQAVASEYSSIQSYKSSDLVLLTLSANLHVEEAVNFQKIDFAIKPLNTESKEIWINRGLQFFKSHGSNSFDWSEFFLQGETFLGLGPKDATLAQITFAHELDNLKTRVQSLSSIESFRQTLLEGELKNYRGERRTLTAVFLDWGGNCVSQTLLMVSLLKNFPQIVPAGYEVGVAVFTNHLEAVLINQNEVWFLVSGKRIQNSNNITVLKPEALIIEALRVAGVRFQKGNDAYYISGNPSGNTPGFDVRMPKLFGTEIGLVGGLGSHLFSIKSDITIPDNAPDWATMSYQPSNAVKNLGGVLAATNVSSKTQATDVVPGYKMADLLINKTHVKVCLLKIKYTEPGSWMHSPSPGEETDCRYDHAYSRPYAGEFDLGSLEYQINSKESVIWIYVPQKDFATISKLPPPFWIQAFLQKSFLNTMKYLGVKKLDDGDFKRVHESVFNTSDIRFIKYLAKLLLLVGSNHLYNIFPGMAVDLKLPGSENIHTRSGSLEEDLYAYMLINNEIQKNLRAHPPDEAKNLEKMFVFSRLVLLKISENPRLFIESYSKWDSSSRLEAMRFFRDYIGIGFRQHKLDYIWAAQSVRDYLNSLGAGDLAIVQDKVLQTNNCGPFKVSPPQVSGGWYPLTNGIKVCDKSNGDSARGTKAKELAGEAGTKQLKLSPIILAELGITFSGGIQLWDKATLSAALASVPYWIQWNIFDGLQGDQGDSDRIFPDMAVGLVYNRKWLEKYNWIANTLLQSDAIQDQICMKNNCPTPSGAPAPMSPCNRVGNYIFKNRACYPVH